MGATLTDNQVICSKCEEAVHRYATRCPYCNHEFKSQPTSGFIQASKVTHLHQIELPEKPQPVLEVSKESEESNVEENGSSFSLFLSLLMLLGGSFFLFFGLMVKLFSKNGRFVLEWSADSWPYFLFPALFLLMLGLISLSSVPEEAS